MIERNIQESDDEGFTRYISRSKRRSIATGTKKPSDGCKLKSADRFTDIYIGRCNEDITPEILSEYMKTDLGISARKCEQLTTKIPYSSAFKVTVHFNDKFKALNPDSWPEGVACRMFFTPKVKY